MAFIQGWTMPSEVEEYLDAFENVHRLALRLHQAAEKIRSVADTLTENPQSAFTAITQDWPTQEHLKGLVQDLVSAKSQLPLLWARLPEKVKNSFHHKRPDIADHVRFTVED